MHARVVLRVGVCLLVSMLPYLDGAVGRLRTPIVVVPCPVICTSSGALWPPMHTAVRISASVHHLLIIIMSSCKLANLVACRLLKAP